MFRNYLKVALRTMRKQFGYSFINITGLAIGLACCFVILLFVQHELNYDNFHEKGDRIYRALNASREDASNRTAVTSSGYAPHMMEDIAEVEAAVRVWANRAMVFKYGSNDGIRVTGATYVDENFFDVFSYSMLRGNPSTALNTPGKMVVTEQGARTLFGTDDPMGKVVTFFSGANEIAFEVTGIVDTPPTNSHLQFDYLVSFKTLLLTRGADALEDYTDFNYQTYVLLNPGTTPEQFTEHVPGFIAKRRNPRTAETRTVQLQPLADIHFGTNIGFDPFGRGNKQYLYIFSAIAVFILLIACINFMNLSTARATQRAKEVGVRKAVGAIRSQLIGQFYGESLLAVVLALVLGLGLTIAAAPYFTALLGREISFSLADNIGLVSLMVSVGLLTGLAAGSYPAFVLSGFNPVLVLKGLATRGQKGSRLRKVLIVLQFSISVVLIIAVTTVYLQLRHMKSQALGFNKEQVIFANVSGDVKARFDTFRQGLMQTPNIQQVSLMGNMPGRVNTNRGYRWPGLEPGENEQGRSFYTMLADPYSLETLDLELVAGRFFDPDMPTDADNMYVLNETAARLVGWDESAEVDQGFRAWDDEMGQVIGVVKDFHFQSLHQEIQPVVIDVKRPWSWNAVMRVSGNNLPATIAHLERQWKQMEPVQPLRYRFLDEDFDRLYRTEEELGELFGVFTGLAIFIACLGLFGLVSFAAERRTKEIGIRKVLGASVAGIFMLIAKEFTRLVIVAFIIAAPLAYYAMDTWLTDFAYRINVGPLIFVIAGMAVLTIALVTVSYRSVKAALADPVHALRYE